MHACIVDATVTYYEPQMGQVFILLINQAIKIKGLNHHILCPMYCNMNVTIDEVLKCLAPIPQDNMHAIQIMNPFHATHPIIIPLQLIRFTSYFDVIKSALEEYKKWNILKINLLMEAPAWDSSSPEFDRHEQSMARG